MDFVDSLFYGGDLVGSEHHDPLEDRGIFKNERKDPPSFIRIYRIEQRYS